LADEAIEETDAAVLFLEDLELLVFALGSRVRSRAENSKSLSTYVIFETHWAAKGRVSASEYKCEKPYFVGTYHEI